MFVVGDIGGTNARFAIARTTPDNRIVVSDYEKYSADQVSVFEDGINQFLDKLGYRPPLAIFAVAGPIRNDEVQFTNRAWKIKRQDIIKNCALTDVCLLNDFTAMAHAVPRMTEDSFLPIKPGSPIEGAPILVAGPGTGFGVSLLSQSAGRWHSIATEGGHILYTPRNPIQNEVLRILEKALGCPVSLEHVTGGAFLNVLAQAVSEIHGVAHVDRSPQKIIEDALQGDPLSADICTIRVEAIMTGLGNLALVGGARGGIVLAGGVGRHLINFLTTPSAIHAFESIWPENNYLRDIPIRLLTNPMAPLIGAAAQYMEEHHD